MIDLPRLNQGIQFVGPEGKPTQQGSTVWDALCTAIENNLDSIDATETSLQTQIGRINDILDGTSTTTPNQTVAYNWTAQQTFGVAPIAPGYKVGANQVVGAQQPTIAALGGGATLGQAITAINAILVALKAHGLIAGP